MLRRMVWVIWQRKTQMRIQERVGTSARVLTTIGEGMLGELSQIMRLDGVERLSRRGSALPGARVLIERGGSSAWFEGRERAGDENPAEQKA